MTPAGPATLLYQWTGPATLEGRPPEVLVGANVVVEAGGKPGTIRIRASYNGVNQIGDPVQLPAEPGTYRFSAPHIRWDYRGSSIGFDQVTGEHAVLSQATCEPEKRFNDPCSVMRVSVERDGQATQTLLGAKLAVSGIFEVDRDEDLAGDTTEDRTDLKVTATSMRNTDGTLRIAATITNAGPRAADLPSLTTSLPGAKIEGCRGYFEWWLPGDKCVLTTPLAAGESRTVGITADSPEATSTTVGVASEGPDLAAADNNVLVAVPAAAAPFELLVTKSQRLRNGVKVQVRGDGPTRITAAFGTIKLSKVVGLTRGTLRTVTLKATGAKLRKLQRAARKHPLKAQITVRSGGQLRASGATTLKR